MKRPVSTILASLALCLVTATSDAAVYYVSPTGDDGTDGSSPAAAWATIDNGETLAILEAGDTVNIVAGEYIIAASITLSSSGTAALPIVYRALEGGRVVINASNTSALCLIVAGDHTYIEGIEATNTKEHAIEVLADSCRITNCYIHDIEKDGIRLEGSYNLVLRNRVLRAADHGIHNRDAGLYNKIYGNTIYGSTGNGIECQGNVETARIFNNIIAGNNKGINADGLNVCAFNSLWNNSGDDYSGGCADSAGGLAVDPQLVHPETGNFHLRHNSPAIDAGLDLGYPFLDAAPEIGAVEYTPHTPVVYYIKPTGDDDADGLDSTTAWASIDNGDLKGLLFPGDTVNILPGTYGLDATVALNTSGTDSLPLVYQKSGEAAVVLDGNDRSINILDIEGRHLYVDGFEITNTRDNGILLAGDSNTVVGCYMRVIGTDGLRVEGSHNLILRNIINVTDHGINNRDPAIGTRMYGNTIYGCGKNGIEFQASSTTARIFNNVIAFNDKGINGKAENVAAFNNLWLNSGGDYAGGVFDSAGGILTNPLMIDPADGDFRLQSGSLAIDAGLDIGYDYRYLAPDMGALEWGNEPPILAGIGAQSTNESVNLTFGLSATDDESTPSLSANGLPDGADFTDHGDGTATFDWTPTFLQSGSYDVTFNATDDWLDVDSEIVTITVDPAQAVTIEVTPDIVTMSSDSSLQFTATGYDAGGYEADPGNLTWGLTNPLGTVDAAGLFDATTVGVGKVYVSSDLGPVDTTSYLEVTPGQLASLEITPDSVETTADDTVPFGASGSDADGNAVGAGTLTWEVLGGIGTIDISGVFSPTTVGTGRIVANSDLGSVVDTSRMVVVTAGDLATLIINPDRDTVSADSTRQFTAAGVDAHGNAVSDLGTLTWGVLDGIGTIDNTGLFDAVNSGAGFIALGSHYGPTALSDSIFVVPGEVVYIDVAPSSNVVSEGETFQFESYGHDADSNRAAVLTATATWSTNDPSGSISTTGLYTAGTDVSPPDYYVWAEYGGFRDSSQVIVLTSGSLSYVRIEYEDGIPVGDTLVTADNDTTSVFCRGYDSGDNLLGDFSVNWEPIDPAGICRHSPSGGVSTTLEVTLPGTLRMVARHASGIADTSGVITVVAGEPASLAISPDQATLSADSSLFFTLESLDADGNPSLPAVAGTWDVLGGIGSITAGGLFTAETVGEGHIIVTGGGLVDTSGTITVVSGALDYLVVTPDSVAVGLGDTVQFTVNGYDALNNETETGDLTWKLIGRTGAIDATGLFVATRTGIAVVAATSAAGPADTTGMLAVEELLFTSIPIGTSTVRPGDESTPVLAYRLDNYYDETKTVTGFTFRTAFGGPGNSTQKLGNAESLQLYLDADNDSLLSTEDSLLSVTALEATSVAAAIDPIALDPGSGRTFLATLLATEVARDDDTLDLYLRPALDIQTEDATIVAGPDSAGSLGQVIVDGMVAAQVTLYPSGNETIHADDYLYAVLSLDIPRNGYGVDTLTALSLTSLGTVTATDLDSLCLFLDCGGQDWHGPEVETPIGRLYYTGTRWTATGLSVVLDGIDNRFHVAADIADFPAPGHTIALGIPLNGIEVASGNDGPIDFELAPVDTITIQSDQQLTISIATQPARRLVPGELSDPLVTLQLDNSYAATLALDSLRLNLSLDDPDGATPNELDSQIDSVLLYLERDGNTARLMTDDSLLAVGYVAGGVALLATDGLAFEGMGDRTTLSVSLALSAAHAKDGNTINVGLASSDDLFFDQPVLIEGTFPAQNLSEHVVDAFPATSVETVDPGNADLNAGAKGVLVFDFTLPGNGYASDALGRLVLKNIGTVIQREAIAGLSLWSDDTGDGFSLDDGTLGSFVYNDDEWVFSDPTVVIPPDGRRLLVTADISSGQFETGTLQLQLPVDGCRYSSGLVGPDDLPVTAPTEYRVYPADRITVISVPKATSTVHPGQADILLLSFALYNGYGGEAQALEGLTFVNGTRSRSTDAFADHELGQVSLHYDADNNRVLNDDPLVANGYFVNGQLQLSGLDLVLSADSLSYFFITAEVPLDLIDYDSLDLFLPGPADLVFSQPVVINGDLPLLSGGYRVVDGSVAAQYVQVDQNPGTLSPGDTDVTLFAFQPALNGDLADTLEAVRILNLGDADSSDVSAMELWLDVDGDEALGGGDSLLAAFSYAAVSGWTGTGLSLEIQGLRPTLFVVADIAISATTDRTFRWQLPVNGCTYASANDGPRDIALVSSEIFSISASPLGVAYQPLNDNYTVGQTIAARFSVTNRQGTPVSNVMGRLVGYADSATIVIDSSSVGPVTLDPGQTTQFAFYGTAAAVGPISFDLQAVADADSSAILHTNPSSVQQHPTDVVLQFTNSIPTAVTKGQANVFPFSVGMDHPDETGTVAAIRIDSLKIDVTDGLGTPTVADAVFSRIVLTAGYTNLAVVDAVPTQSAVTLIFTEPVVVAAGEDVQFSLLVDIDSLASADSFVLSVTDATALPMVDNNSGQPVNVDAGVTFPLSTASCRIDEPSQLMALSYTSLVGPTVNYGQTDVAMVQLDLRHPGSLGTSQIQITDVSLELVDGAGTPVTASDLIDRLRLIKHSTVIGELSGSALDTVKPSIQLSSPVTLNPGEIDSIRVSVTIGEITSLSEFSLRIPDSLSFVVRDLSSGSSLATTTDTLALATGSTFPVESNQTEIMNAAVPPLLCPTSLLPSATVGGVDSLELIELTLRYPVPIGYSSLCMDQILVTVTDTLGAPLDPAHLFDRLGYIDPSGTPSYQQFVLTESGSARFTLGTGGLQIDPGDSLSLTLIGDISVGSTVDHFVLVIGSESNFRMVDVSDTTSHPGLATGGECTTPIPFATSLTSVYQPAGRPDLTGGSGPVQIAHRGQQDVTIFRADLVYDNPISEGDLSIDGLHGRLWQRTVSGFVPVNEGTVFDSITLYIDGLPVAGDLNPSDDSLALAFESTLTVQQGDQIEVALVSHIRTDAALGNYVVRFEDSTFLEIADANLSRTVYPVLAGNEYPVQGIELSILVDQLTASFSNYPNPFNPDEGPTVIAYVLPEAARVDIEVFTITGELVKEVAMDVMRPAGSNQVDAWSGANGAGLEVVPGTYFCRITVRYESGTEETMRRKVAVVR